jgi:Co/Zn/Cd efflux system component
MRRPTRVSGHLQLHQSQRQARGTSMGRRSKQRVALSSVFASLLLTGTKGVVGMLTGSLAILSEAAHSALNMLAALLRAKGPEFDRIVIHADPFQA